MRSSWEPSRDEARRSGGLGQRANASASSSSSASRSSAPPRPQRPGTPPAQATPRSRPAQEGRHLVERSGRPRRQPRAHPSGRSRRQGSGHPSSRSRGSSKQEVPLRERQLGHGTRARSPRRRSTRGRCRARRGCRAAPCSRAGRPWSTRRVSPTARSSRRSPSRSASPASSAAGATHASDASAAPRPEPANIGRPSTGCGVGIEAFGSPIGAHAIAPPLMTTCGRTPKNARIPEHEVGELADLDRADLARRGRARPPGRSCTSRRSAGPARCRRARRSGTPSRAFIACAVCQVRMIVSPTRPIACESEPIIEIAPRSCRTSSAAIVVARIRLSAKARSSGTRGLRWWQTMSMSRCSATVLTVCGRVGFVEDGSTFGNDAIADDVRRVAAAGALGVVGVDRSGRRSPRPSTRGSRPR